LIDWIDDANYSLAMTSFQFRRTETHRAIIEKDYKTPGPAAIQTDAGKSGFVKDPEGKL
jgi:hypothetical protein